MAQDLQIKITTASAATITFAVEGDWTWAQEARYKEAANPPELEELREVWEVSGALLRSSDGTQATGWDEFQALKANYETRDAPIIRVEVIRDPDGTPVSELTLGPAVYEQFKLESVSGAPSTLAPSASYRTLFPVSFRFSAVRKFADANGITGWEQSVSVTYANALKTLAWDTFITTAEGTSALTKAKLYGAIPLASLGSSFTYTEGNGDDGVDYTILDADEENSRTPTQVRARSSIRQWGVTVGATAAGSSPDTVHLEDGTRTTADEFQRTRTARAEGAGAKAWVVSQKPTWAQEEDTVHDRANQVYSATWTSSEASTKRDAEDFWAIQGEISGGHQALSLEPISGNFPPVRFDGPRLPWALSVAVTVTRRGGTGLLSELKLPPLLGDPWALDYSASSESEPYLAERGATADADRWTRTAKLVYRAATVKPKSDPITGLRARKSEAVESYWLR